MENEPELIRQQMASTRTVLSNKLEVLQDRVVATVGVVSTAVVETAENIQEAVEETVRTVQRSAQVAMETVKDACDLPLQVELRPWTMMAGATALGFLGGHLLHGRRPGRAKPNGSGAAATRSVEDEPGWLANLAGTIHPELAQLKGLAVGTLLGIVRDVVTKSVPEPMERQVEDVINGITVKLGGHPLRGRLMSEEPERGRSTASGNREVGGSHDRSGSESFTSRARS